MTDGQQRKNPRRWIPGILGLAASHFLFILFFYAPAISTPDANPYMAQGRRITETGRTVLTVESPVQFVPAHWVMAEGAGANYPQGRFTKYPPGVPLLVAPLYAAFGMSGALLLNPILTTLAVMGVFFLAVSWMPPAWALIAAALTAMSPVLLYQAHWSGSHPAVVALLVWGLVALVRWKRGGGLRPAVMAGLLFGAIPTMRYPEAVLLAAAAIFALWVWHRRGRPLAELLVMGSLMALPSLALAVRNHRIFGAFGRTGYAGSGEQAALSLRSVLTNGPEYLQGLMADGAGPILVLGLLGLSFWLTEKERRPAASLLLGLSLPLFFLYSAYYWPVDPLSLRFLTPILPLLCVAAAGFLASIAGQRGVLAPVTAAVVLATAALWGIPPAVRALATLRASNQLLAQLTETIRDEVPEGSVIVVDDLTGPQLDFVGSWKLAAGGDGIGGRGGPGIAAAGFWPRLGQSSDAGSGAFLREIQAWAGGNDRIFFLVGEEVTPPVLDDLEEVARIEGREGAALRGEPSRRPPGGAMPPRRGAGARAATGPGTARELLPGAGFRMGQRVSLGRGFRTGRGASPGAGVPEGQQPPGFGLPGGQPPGDQAPSPGYVLYEWRRG